MESSHLSHSRLEEQENAYSYHNNNNGTSKVVKVSLSMSVSESQTWKRKTTVSTSSQLASSMDLRSHCEEGVCLAGEGLTACSHAHRHRSAKTVTPPPPPVTESAAVHQTRHSKKTEANRSVSFDLLKALKGGDVQGESFDDRIFLFVYFMTPKRTVAG